MNNLIKGLLLAYGVILLSSPAYAMPKALKTKVTQFENNLISKMKWGKSQPRHWHINARLYAHRVPGASVAIIENYQVVWASGYGTKQVNKSEPVDSATLFSVGSVSKMVNAALILRLVAEEQLSLDTNINQYLTRWQVKDNHHTKKQPVTLRTILSHTAGFNVHGFPDFKPGARLPTVLQTLEGKSPARHGRVKVTFEPGTEMDYSGGGITVSQLAVTDTTGLSYVDAAAKYVFAPLNMTRSTFQNPVPATMGNIAHAHNGSGHPSAQPRGWEAMPEMAASGLWTSADDLAKFVIALMQSYKTEDGFLPQSIAHDMMTKENHSWYGLGPRINGEGDTLVFHHGGANNSYRAWIEGHINSGNGIVILTNGTNGHFVHMEMRRAAQEAFGWTITSGEGFEEPDL